MDQPRTRRTTRALGRLERLSRTLPRRLDHIQGVEVGGKIYYIGGLAGWPRPHADSVYIYDPQTDTFTTAPRCRGVGAGRRGSVRGRIYYAGGLHDGRAVPWFDVYDPRADSWFACPTFLAPRDHFHAAVVDGKLYAIGGRDTEIGREIAETDVYDIEAGTWHRLAPVPTVRGGFGVAASGPRSWSSAVRTPDGAHAEVEAYDTRTNSWRALEPLPTPRHGIQAAVCGGAIYVAAGGTTPGGDDPSDVMGSIGRQVRTAVGRNPLPAASATR